jgi:hypothetical protein
VGVRLTRHREVKPQAASPWISARIEAIDRLSSTLEATASLWEKTHRQGGRTLMQPAPAAKNKTETGVS